MATVHVVLTGVQGRVSTGAVMPVCNSQPIAVNTMTSSGTSAESGIAGAEVGNFWNVTATGGNVYVKAGGNPTAATENGYLVLDGQTRDFAVTVAGEELAVVDA